jgi:hypothetical protein
MTPDPLAVALAASKPLEVEMLVSDHARRVSVGEHQAFREGLAPRPAVDPIDELPTLNPEPTAAR